MSRKKIFSFFENSKTLEFYPDFEPKTFGKVVKIAFFCPDNILGRKNLEKIEIDIFLGVLAKNFKTLTEKLRYACQTCNLRAHRNISGFIFFKREHLHSESTNSEEKSPHTEGMIFFS